MIGEQIKKIRKKHNLSQSEFGNIFDVCQRTVSAWEIGQNEPPFSVIIKIFKIWGISPSFFLDKTDELEYLIDKVKLIVKNNQNKNQELKELLESFIQKNNLEKLNSIVRSFKIEDLVKLISKVWSEEKEKAFIVLHYFIEHLESQEQHQRNDKDFFIDILKRFKISKKNQAKYSLKLSKQDQNNLIDWVEKNLDELDISILFVDIPKAKKITQLELNKLGD